MSGWLDGATGALLSIVTFAAWGRCRRYAVVVGLCALAWVAGDVSDQALLVHRPLLLHAVLAYPDGQLPGRPARWAVAVAWLGVAVAPVGAHPAFPLLLAGLVAVQAWRIGAERAWGRRGLAVTSARAAALVAASLAIPAAIRLRWTGPVAAERTVLLYDGLVAATALVLVAGLLLRSPAGEADAMIELSDRTPHELLEALRQEVTSRLDPVRRPGPEAADALLAAVALLESNAALQSGLAEKVQEVRSSRSRLVVAADSERQRLERVLAGGALRYLGELEETLSALAESQDPSAHELAGTCLEEVTMIRDDVDQLARGLHPRTLADLGLAAALKELADHCPLPVAVTVPWDRFPESAETALWYACAEALANLGKHAEASAVAIDVRLVDGELRAVVQDDGVGGATMSPGGGLTGLVDRLAAVGGRLDIRSAPGGGTQVRIQVPVT